MGAGPSARKEERFGQSLRTGPRPAGAGPAAPEPDQHYTEIEELTEVRVETRLLRLRPGLCVLGVGASRHGGSRHAGLALPALHISAPPPSQAPATEIVAASCDGGCWFGADGGTVIIKAPREGGCLLVTSYQHRADPNEQRAIAVSRLEPPEPPAQTGPIPPPRTARIIAVEALLHIERSGDCRVPAEGWIGNLGKKLRLEAFGIRPLEGLTPAEIEYRAFGPNGRETEWVSDGRLCGTRGRGLPLTGFAVRLAAHQAHRFSVEYHGAFFDSGICGPARDGAPCLPRIPDDPLEAISLRLYERPES